MHREEPDFEAWAARIRDRQRAEREDRPRITVSDAFASFLVIAGMWAGALTVLAVALLASPWWPAIAALAGQLFDDGDR
ncbi:hypothetical protein KUV85_06195 [Nocardioides panacisoli]|uniref:hypothetical protein n=1 Tax=Nocardioides panacisoli TaxID=627624 RepID=UPI001C63572E|nr:hypothetical protein [Nocardioides panacisoli]QYJ05263.1 hypothetical protein KUV85_06195 [Nocardioides panacisoli]